MTEQQAERLGRDQAPLFHLVAAFEPDDFCSFLSKSEAVVVVACVAVRVVRRRRWGFGGWGARASSRWGSGGRIDMS
jgi:hypothetical protein